MNKHLLTLALCLVVLSPLIATRWKTYTNTTYVNDYIEANNKLYVATWGGLAVFKHDTTLTGAEAYELDHTYTNIDGLSNNDVRVLDYIPATDQLWMGLYAGGVNILTPQGIKILNETSGLPSNKITGIAHSDTLFFVSTDKGLAVFYQMAQVSFPLLSQVYTNSYTEGGLVNDSLFFMKLAPTNYLYLGTPQGLSYVHIDSLNINSRWHTWNTTNSNIPGDRISQIALFEQKIAVSTTKGLGIVDLSVFPNNWIEYNSSNGLESDSVYSINYSASGDLYFSYGAWHENIMTLNNESNTALNILSADGHLTKIPEGTLGLNNKAVTKIKNLNGKMSLSSWGDGLFFDATPNWFNVITNSIGFNTVSCITHSKGKTWFGSGNLGIGKTKKGTRGISSFDGNTWQTFTVKNSPLISDNILSLAVDDKDRLWMAAYYTPTNNTYGWGNGLNIYDPSNNSWDWMDTYGLYHYIDPVITYRQISTTPAMLSQTLTYVYHDSDNRMFVCCYNGGIIVLDSLYQKITSFQIPNSARQGVILVAESESAYFFGTANDHGVSYWSNMDLLPSASNNNYWHNPQSTDLNNCWVYGIVSFTNDFGENETWIAASNGIYSYNGTNWFKYDVDVKRRIFRNGTWETDLNGLYYYDEERLFGSVHTNPTAIYLDPFRRIWLGSRDNGFSMYDPSTERFTNYNISNSPLISNYVLSLGYDPSQGSLYIGTPDGLNTFQIGFENPPQVSLKKVRAYPNPFKPDRDQVVTIENTASSSGVFPTSFCRIYDLSGDLVLELKQNRYLPFTWNGLNSSGKKCSSGVYYYVISVKDGDTVRGKIALIRG